MANSLTHYIYKFNITKVIDGDTIKGDIDLGFNMKMFNQSIRLMGIDTPELKSKDPIIKQQALECKYFLESVLIKKDCVLPISILSKGKDPFGRILAIVYYGDDCINLNNLLLDTGFATPFIP
jgi:micrococcal nuclease